MLVYFNKTVWHYIPEGSHLQIALSVWQTNLTSIIFQQNTSYFKNNVETYELISAVQVTCHSKTPFRISQKRTTKFILHIVQISLGYWMIFKTDRHLKMVGSSCTQWWFFHNRALVCFLGSFVCACIHAYVYSVKKYSLQILFFYGSGMACYPYTFMFSTC
jgi:hypothetical protein